MSEAYKAELNSIVAEMRNATEKSTTSSDELKTGTKEKVSSDVCPICGGRGWVFINYNTVKECECGLLDRERHDSKLRFANIPENYKDVRLRDFTTKYYSQDNKGNAKAVADAVKYWLSHIEVMTEQGRGLYFWSNTKGSGKTLLMTGLANELINNHKEMVKYSTSLDILDEIRRTYSTNSESESESRLLDDLSTVKYLVIDDFGTEKVTDWTGEKFYQIINKRYINKRVTFFTSNYDLKTIDYDSRITSRIRERAFSVHFPEESVREIKARQDDMRLRVNETRSNEH